jgi:hypothetical protein
MNTAGDRTGDDDLVGALHGNSSLTPGLGYLPINVPEIIVTTKFQK